MYIINRFLPGGHCVLTVQLSIYSEIIKKTCPFFKDWYIVIQTGQNQIWLFNFKKENIMKRLFLFLAIFLSTLMLSCQKDSTAYPRPIDEKYKEVKVEIIKELNNE
jgi:hypothetical protein